MGTCAPERAGLLSHCPHPEPSVGGGVSCSLGTAFCGTLVQDSVSTSVRWGWATLSQGKSQGTVLSSHLGGCAVCVSTIQNTGHGHFFHMRLTHKPQQSGWRCEEVNANIPEDSWPCNPVSTPAEHASDNMGQTHSPTRGQTWAKQKDRQMPSQQGQTWVLTAGRTDAPAAGTDRGPNSGMGRGSDSEMDRSPRSRVPGQGCVARGLPVSVPWEDPPALWQLQLFVGGRRGRSTQRACGRHLVGLVVGVGVRVGMGVLLLALDQSGAGWLGAPIPSLVGGSSHFGHRQEKKSSFLCPLAVLWRQCVPHSGGQLGWVRRASWTEDSHTQASAASPSGLGLRV